MRRFVIAAKIFAASILCVFMIACGSRAEAHPEQGTVTESEGPGAESTNRGSEDLSRRIKKVSSSKAQKKKTGRRLTVLDFSATWCGPCRMFAPIFHEVAEEYKEQADFRTIDIDKEPDLANKFNIQAVPTLIILDENGKVLKRVEGCMDKDDLVSLIREVQ